MRKIQLRKKWEPVTLLDLKLNRLAYNVQKELDFYGISAQMDGVQFKAALNDVIDVDLEKAGGTEDTRGKILVRKGWRGEYYSVKNIRFHAAEFLKWGLELAFSDEKGRVLICAMILLELMKQLKDDLGKSETIVCVALYKASKRHVLTDDNVIMYIEQELQESGCGEPEDEKEIGESLSALINRGLVSIGDGRYEVTQEVYF